MANELIAKEVKVPDMGGIFSTSEKFDLALKMATSLSKSTMVPKEFQGNISNCVIAVDMAERTKMSPFMVMQNIYIVYGRPSWSSQFIGALINASRRYKEPIHYEMNGSKTSCFAWSIDQKGNKVEGPTVTIQMAKDEGWYGKNGSKWQTMPEIMLRYRALSFFGRMYCGDLLMGMYSQDEVIEMRGEVIETDEQKSMISEEIAEKANKGKEIGFESEADDNKPIEELKKGEEEVDCENNIHTEESTSGQMKFEAAF